MTHPHPGVIELLVMWQAMMVAMMLPIVLPWMRVYARVDPRPTAVATFGVGYFTAWLGFSVVAAIVQSALLRFVGTPKPVVSALVLVLAGAYQIAPLKRACLRHCRNPLTYLLGRWDGGPRGGLALGFGHGVHCVGCCWALMLTALALGVMNLWWMVVVAAASFVEQVVPRGDRLRVPLGVALVSAGVLAWAA